MPGKPAPDPKSERELQFLKSIYLISWAESKICLCQILFSESIGY